MKISIVICIFLAVHCYGRSVKVKRQASCKSVEYDLGMVEFNQYVTNEMKAEVCAKSIVNYNSHARIPIKYLGGEYNYITHQNPCTVVCRYDPTAHESIVDVHSTSVEHTATEPEPLYTLEEYRALPMGLFHVAEKTVCGPQHMCDANGCCVKEEPQPEEHKEPEQPEEHKEPEIPVEHKEPEAPQEPHQDPETPVEHKEPEVPEQKEPEVPEHKEPEVPEEHKEPETPEEHKQPETPEEHKQPETPEEHKEPEAPQEPHQEPEHPEEHKEPEVPEEHKEPENPEEHKEPEHPEEHKEPEEPQEPHKEPEEHHEPEQPKEPEVPEKEYACKEPGVFADDEDQSSFFYCYLKSAHIKCSEGTVFNKEKKVCDVLDPHYTEHISCAHEGYFRNPYDCNRFYRCYYNDANERAAQHLRIAFYTCSQSMVFDNAAQTCVLPSATQACDNILLNVQTHLYRQ